jgi:hypothetical protein
MKETNYKKGDIFPENDEIREHFFNLGNKGEYNWDAMVGSNENVEIKTQDFNNTIQYGNLFVEHSARYAGKQEIVPSGIRTTECDTWVFQFVDRDGKYHPISININKDYLLEVIRKGMEEGIAREIPTNNLETGDTNYGYLLSILYLFQPLIINTHQIPRGRFCNPAKPEMTEQEKRDRLRNLEVNKKKNEANKTK